MKGTVAWVIGEYRQSAGYRKLKPSTQDVYERRFAWLHDNYGSARLADLEERHLRKMRNDLKADPSVADAIVDMMGRLWRYAKEHLEMMLGQNPSAEVAAIHTEHKQHPAWTPELCAKFEQLDHPSLVLAYYLLRYTGQRRGDVALMKWADFDGTAIKVIQEKTSTPVWIPCHPILRGRLAVVPRAGDYMILSPKGGHWRGTSITNEVCEACKESGFPGYSPHGLRHLAGAALAEAGCTVHEIMAILGHLKSRRRWNTCAKPTARRWHSRR